MKKILLAGVACFVPAWGAAFAADMPVKAPIMAPPVLTWTGFYFGGNAGIDKSFGDATDAFVALTGTDTFTGGIGAPFFLPPGQIVLSTARVGGEGGVQAGYNWQAGMWVFGIEADFDGSTASEDQTLFSPNANRVPETVRVGTKLLALGTARGRIGWATSGSSMLYLTGGFAYGEHELSLAAFAPAANPVINAAVSARVWDTGWVVGGGWEGRLWDPRWSIKGELLFVSLRDLSVTIPYAYGVNNSSSLTATLRENDFVARAGLNYHIGP